MLCRDQVKGAVDAERPVDTDGTGPDRTAHEEIKAGAGPLFQEHHLAPRSGDRHRCIKGQGPLPGTPERLIVYPGTAGTMTTRTMVTAAVRTAPCREKVGRTIRNVRGEQDSSI
jgi:hypothetical protein